MNQIQLAPRQSPNDAGLKIIQWLIDEGTYVAKGRNVCTVEGSKAVFDVQSEFEGFIYFLVAAGESVEVGHPMALFTARKEDKAKSDFLKKVKGTKLEDGGKKFTKKAELLARQHSISLNDICKDGTIREEDILMHVRTRLDDGRHAVHETLIKNIDLNLKKRVVILGAGVGAVQIADIIVRNPQQEIAAILDDDQSVHGKAILGQKISGSIDMIHQLWQECAFDGVVISFSRDLSVRMKLFSRLSSMGIPFTNIIDSSVQINSNAGLGNGNVLLAGVVIAACARVGNNNFISAHVNIDHHTIIGDGCSFGPGVMTSGEVKVGDQVKFGTGIFIEPRVHIGSRSIVSSGIALTGNVPEGIIVRKILDYKI